jgi:hypothetical protein
MSEINEFAINLPMSGVTAVMPASIGGGTDAMADMGYDITANTAMPPDVAPECKHINVSVDSATITNYDPAAPMVNVDLVLNVSISNDSCGMVSSYKIVKRLGMDRIKLALQAEGMEPYQVLEDADDAAEVERMMSEFYAAKRARELCGLAESAGKRVFNVMFKFPEPTHTGPGETWNSGTVKIDAVKDAAHARHVFAAKHAHKYPGVKITRATEVK